jgi:Sulfotransferase family
LSPTRGPRSVTTPPIASAAASIAPDLLTLTPPFPDFFVVGAPRCGTTSFCRYLARNPQICFSQPKEPHYFAQLAHDPSEDELARDYLQRCFGHHGANHRRVGEGSVSYLYLPEAIRRIRRLNPEARFIALVRDPLAMLPSYHLRMRFLLQEDEPDFAAAWAREPARARGEQVPPHCRDARLLLYSKVGELGAQVERLFAVAGRERSHVVVFDDLVADPLAVYRRALEFLDVDYDGQTGFESRYESRMYRYRWLQRLLFVPAMRGGKMMRTLQQRTRKYNPDGSKRTGLIKRVTRWNKVAARPAPLTPQMKDVVRATLQPDVALLARLLDRDLSHWLAG